MNKRRKRNQTISPARFIFDMLRYRSNPLHIAYLNGKYVLDVGCGTGEFLKKESDNRVGIDINKQLVQHCRKSKLNAEVMSATELSFPAESFDVVHAAELIEHLEPTAAVKFLTSASKVLKPNGIIYLTTPGIVNVWNTFSHVRPYPPMAFEKLLEKSTENFIYEDELPLKLECYYAFSSSSSKVITGIKKAINVVIPPRHPNGYIIILRKSSHKSH